MSIIDNTKPQPAGQWRPMRLFLFFSHSRNATSYIRYAFFELNGQIVFKVNLSTRPLVTESHAIRMQTWIQHMQILSG